MEGGELMVVVMGRGPCFKVIRFLDGYLDKIRSRSS